MKIDSIIIGERVRKDMGDLQGLADSIKRHGLLHPIVVKPDGSLIAGHRRIEAVKLLGWTEIQETVIDVENLVMAERDENVERKDFAPTELVAIGRLLEAQIAPAAAVRMRIGKPSHEPCPGKTTRIVARKLGVGANRYEMARRIVNSAEANPETFGDLPEQMDAQSVETAHRELKRRKNGQGRHPIFRKMRYIDPNRVVQRAVWSLDGICEALEKLDLEGIDQSKTNEWAAQLRKSSASLFRTAKRLSNGK